MNVRVSGPARADLQAAFEFIYPDSPQAAETVFSTLLDSVRGLGTLPRRGRPGRIHGTRELVVPRTGHILVYAIREGEVVVLRVRHGRQRPG